jgi:predicted acylesterase/phospholipase RssA
MMAATMMGALDRLLEEPWLRIEGISGTSAGAMNAAVLVYGYQKGGAEGARAALTVFWRRVSESARFSPFQRGPMDVLLGRWTLDSSPMYVAMDLMSRLVSHYDLNPKGGNPLRDILAEQIDFGVLAQSPINLFITSTNVRTGRGKVFKNGHHAGCAARLRLPADDVPGDRDRRRGLLGWRLFGQSDALNADPRNQGEGHHLDPDQPDRANAAAAVSK